jgi:hypothetical protein
MSSQTTVPGKHLARDPRTLRRACQLNVLLPSASRWLEILPAGVQPRGLVKQFPRIANILARSWDNPDYVERYLSELLIDQRGTRQGFPPDVHLELLNLRDYVAGLVTNRAQR